jgi:SAM-dependent methyltransferase
VSGTDAYTRLAGVYDEIVVDPCYDRWADFLVDAWREDDAGVRSVLDVCCGTGLMAAELEARGCRVTGVDASASMLDRARSLLGPGAVLVQQTLPHLSVDGVFDAAVSTFDGLNYLTPDELGASLQAVAQHLRPGGWLAFDLHTDAMMHFTAANPVVDGEAHGRRFTISSEVDVEDRACDTTIVVTRLSDGDTFTERHRQSFFTDGQVRRALGEAGFAITGVTEEYTTRPVSDSTLRATWVAHRSG